ncbi:hypothetical protein ACFQL0_07070 [Haloplanus litoreus]
MSIDQEATNANGGGTGSKTNVKLDDITKIFQDDEEERSSP